MEIDTKDKEDRKGKTSLYFCRQYLSSLNIIPEFIIKNIVVLADAYSSIDGHCKTALIESSDDVFLTIMSI
jgi:hypothetical protein